MLDRVLERSIFYNLLPRDGKLSIARSNLRHLRNPFWKITKQVLNVLIVKPTLVFVTWQIAVKQ